MSPVTRRYRARNEAHQSKWTLDRETFLKNRDVVAFIKRTRKLLNEDLPERVFTWDTSSTSPAGPSKVRRRRIASHDPFHSYHHHKPAYDWWCANLIDAAAGYRFSIKKGLTDSIALRWQGHDSLRANAGVLGFLQAKLRAAYKKDDHDTAADVARNIQIWGGTLNGNVQAITRLNSTSGRFCGYLRWCKKCFGNGKRINFVQPRRVPEYTLRSNAGFTKIYSLLFDNFVIYDSRVAAGLGKLVVRDAKAQNLTAIPKNLQDLVWMPGRTQRLRDPSSGPYAFIECGSNNDNGHLRSNVKANWILAAVLPGTNFRSIVAAHPYFMPVTPLRALEAALFMIGYDLKGNSPYQE